MNTVAVKERPIVFSGEMVRAILDRRKTQTRRIVRPQLVWTPYPDDLLRSGVDRGFWSWERTPNDMRGVGPDGPWDYILAGCPFGRPGDRLWVRETWAAVEPLPSGRVEYEGARIVEVPGGPVEIWYRADGALGIPCLIHDDGPRWSPSIHMPRWASRITLEITDVRVQRVQDITEADALAEGIRFFARDDFGAAGYSWAPRAPRAESAKNAFMELWNSTYGEGAWERNEWVWAITFRRIEP